MGAVTSALRGIGKAAVGIFTDNSLRAAAGLLPGVLPGGQGVPPTRGTQEFLRAYSQMPWLRAVTARVATDTARVEWQLFKTQSKGAPKAHRDKRLQRAGMVLRRQLLKQAAQRDDLQEITDHPMLDVLHKANEFHTGFNARKLTQLHLDLVGDAFWLKERDAGGMVVAYWPIPPHWVLATPTPAFRFFRVSFRAWRGSIPDTEFLWFSDPDPLNPYGRGTGVAMALGDELDTDEYAARHTKAFFYNSARPDLLVWPTGTGMQPAEVRRLEEDWTNNTQGFWRAFKPYFMTREVGVKVLDQNFRNTQLVPLREFERNCILQNFGMPPEILGVLENSNRSTIDAAGYLMARYVTEPRLEFQRTVLQEFFVPEFDERLIVDYVSPVQDDQERFMEVAKQAPWALSADEWRQMMGQLPHEDPKAGKLHAVPTTMHLQPLEEYEPPPAPVMLPGVPGAPPPKPPKPGAPPPPKLVGDTWTAAVEQDISTAAEAGDVELGAALQRSLAYEPSLPEGTRLATRQEPALARALVRAWTDHQARVPLARIEHGLSAPGVLGDIVAALDVHALNDTQTAALRPALERAVKAGAELGVKVLARQGADVRGNKPNGLAVDMAAMNPLAAEWAREHAAALVQAPAEVREDVRRLVERSLREGIPPAELAKLIREVVGLLPRQVAAVAAFRARKAELGLAADVLEARVARYALAQRRSRALTIARTELMAATNRGQMLLWQQAVSQQVIRADQFDKVWIVTNDELLEQECEDVDDEQVPIEENFSCGVDAPPLHPNCRCTIGLVPTTRAARAEERAPAAAPAEVHVHVEQAPHQPAHQEPKPSALRVRRRRVERDEQGYIREIVDTIEGD